MTERTRSFWAWGYEDRFPDTAARLELAQQVGAVLGVPLTPRPLPDAARVELGAPRVTLPAHLLGHTSTDKGARMLHTYGKSFRDIVRAFRCDFACAPDAVFSPDSEDQIAGLLEHCAKEKIAVVPFGGGTSVVGGVEAGIGVGYAGVVSLDLGKLDRVHEVDLVSRAARIGAGATGPRIDGQLALHGLSLRHFPQSFELSTLGGWIATRAGGHFATLFTHIDDLVESVRMVTPQGVFETRRLPSSGAGPSADRLVLGSEGIFGVITEAWIRVHPRPKWRASASVHFARFEDGVSAARALAQSGLYPSNCRLLDAREALLHRVTTDGASVLLLGFESADHPLEPWMERALSIATDLGGTCDAEPIYKAAGERVDGRDLESLTPPDASKWRESFLGAPYLQSALISLGLVVDTFETACTWDRFATVHAAVIDAVTGAMKRVTPGGLLSCRFSHVYPDGPVPYYTFIAPGKEGAELEQWAEIKRAASEALLANGATITHHHGVGRIHRPQYDRERPPLFGDTLRAAKAVFDPAHILNPGVLI